MTSRRNESSGGGPSTQPDARPNQVSFSPQNDEEGCPVIEESGTVCGETRTLNIIQDFRAIYDNCMRKMEGNKDDNLALKQLAPFRKLVEDLWEQNAMLVETVEELEQEATNRVTMLQNKLEECSEKVNEYLQDIDSLVEVIRRFRENGKLDTSGLKFNNSFDFEIRGSGKNSDDNLQETNPKSENIERGSKTPESADRSDINPGSERSRQASTSRRRDSSSFSVSGESYSGGVKLQTIFEKPEICCECFETKPYCDCDNRSEEECEMNLAIDSTTAKPGRSAGAKEGVGNVENPDSNEDDTRERRNKTDDITATIVLQCERRILENLKGELMNRKVQWKNASELLRNEKRRGVSFSEVDNNSPTTAELSLTGEHSDIEDMLRLKDREICCLKKELSGKDELLSKYYSQIDELKRDMKNRSRKYQQVLCRLKDAVVQRLNKFSVEDLNLEGRELEDGAIEILFNAIFREIDNQKLRFARRIEEAEYDIQNVTLEKNQILSEQSDMKKCLESLRLENSSLRSELTSCKNVAVENEGLRSRFDEVKRERDQLLEKVNSLHHNIQELDTSFKETRWALTAEVAEKHDQIQELKRALVCLEEQARQADMKTLFKDGVIKEMRKELKNSRMTVCTVENVTKLPVQDIPPLDDKVSWNLDVPVKEKLDEDVKLDIHIFPLQETDNRKMLTRFRKHFYDNICSVEIQTESKKKTLRRTRSVSTQHTTRVQKLPRSFGTLTVTPWSGEGPVCNVDTGISVDNMEKLKQITQVPTAPT